MTQPRRTGRHVRPRGLTQEQFAEHSGFSQQYISGLENGRRNPTIVTVYELAQALGVGHLDLLQPIQARPKPGRPATARSRRQTA